MHIHVNEEPLSTLIFTRVDRIIFKLGSDKYRIYFKLSIQ